MSKVRIDHRLTVYMQQPRFQNNTADSDKVKLSGIQTV